MEELIGFLKTHPHIKTLYMVGDKWYINKPNIPHNVVLASSLLNVEPVAEEVQEVKQEIAAEKNNPSKRTRKRK